jgi:DNA-binding CsgD family transcriptional regulator
VSEAARGIVLLGEPVGPRPDARQTRGWLARLGSDLDGLYGDQRIVPFAAAGGTQLRGLLVPDADPLAAPLLAALREDGRRMRWAIAAGRIEPTEDLRGEPAGEAFEQARGALERGRRGHDSLVLVTGDPGADSLLDALGPVLGDTLARLTARQRTVAGLLMLSGRRQAEVAEQLGVSRQTISVNVARSRLRSLTRLVAAVAAVFAQGARVTDPVSPRGTRPARAAR